MGAWLSRFAPFRPVVPRGAWSAVALLWLAGGSAYLTRTMLGTMRVSVLHDLPMTEAQFGLLTSVFLWCYAALGPLGGFVGDRFKRRWVIIISLAVWAAITVANAEVKSFGAFLALRALLGLGQACYIPAAVALITDFHGGPTRAFATGLNLTGMVCGSLVGSSFGWIADLEGWRFAYLSVGLASAGILLLVYFFLLEPGDGSGGRGSGGSPLSGSRAEKTSPKEAAAPDEPVPPLTFFSALRSLAQSTPFYYLVGSVTVQGAISWIIIAWMPTVIREQFHLGQGAAGFSALGVLYVSQVTGLLVGGAWSDRWSRTNPRGRILLPAYAILLSAPIFLLTGWFHWILLTLASLSAYGLAMGMLGAGQMAIICLVVDPRYRATALGLMNACTAIAGGLAIYGVGALRDAGVGVSLIMMFAGLGVALCGGLLWWVNVALPAAKEA